MFSDKENCDLYLGKNVKVLNECESTYDLITWLQRTISTKSELYCWNLRKS